MNVVNLDAHFFKLTFSPFTLIEYMRQFLVPTHDTNIGIAEKAIPPSKMVGF